MPKKELTNEEKILNIFKVYESGAIKKRHVASMIAKMIDKGAVKND